MLNRLKKYGVDLAGSIFNAGRGYDDNKNFQSIFGMEMRPNIKQKTNANNKKYKKKAAGLFNVSVYHYRGLIEGYLELKKLSIITIL
jgi:hypothetical protein